MIVQHFSLTAASPACEDFATNNLAMSSSNNHRRHHQNFSLNNIQAIYGSADSRMAERRPNMDGPSSFKRQKLSPDDVAPESNPYLSHWNEPQHQNNGFGRGSNGVSIGSGATQASGALARFPRHKTTAAMAKSAEDGPLNAFTGRPLSNQYFNILKVRRNLPVHAQRLVYLDSDNADAKRAH